MLTGVVNSNNEVIVELEFYNNKDKPIVVPCLIDTGYNGFVTMSKSLIADLGLELTPFPLAELTLTTGKTVKAKLYSGYIKWQGVREHILVAEIGDISIIGMSLLIRCTTTLVHRVITIE